MRLSIGEAGPRGPDDYSQSRLRMMAARAMRRGVLVLQPDRTAAGRDGASIPGRKLFGANQMDGGAIYSTWVFTAWLPGYLEV
jgi:hypothetical protein